MTTPVIVKVVNYLRNSREKRALQEIATIIDEPSDSVNKAVGRLVAMKVLVLERGGYTYVASPRNERLCAQLLSVYDGIEREQDRALLLRGLLCQLPAKYAFHLSTLLDIAEQEGLDRREALRFLDGEVARGYMRRLRVSYTGLRNARASRLLPVYMAPYHLSGLLNQGYISTREYTDLEPDGCCPEGYDYVVSRYPPEVAGPARDYVSKGRRELKDFLQGMDTLGWGGWVWRRQGPDRLAGEIQAAGE